MNVGSTNFSDRFVSSFISCLAFWIETFMPHREINALSSKGEPKSFSLEKLRFRNSIDPDGSPKTQKTAKDSEASNLILDSAT
jgi:hypothetical protein